VQWSMWPARSRIRFVYLCSGQCCQHVHASSVSVQWSVLSVCSHIFLVCAVADVAYVLTHMLCLCCGIAMAGYMHAMVSLTPRTVLWW
jgi:hypothetical protein